MWTLERIWLPSSAPGGARPAQEVNATGPVSFDSATVPLKGALFHKFQKNTKEILIFPYFFVVFEYHLGGEEIPKYIRKSTKYCYV